LKRRILRIFSIFEQLRTSEQTIMAILAMIVGLAAGFGAVGFRYLINFFQKICYGTSGNLLEHVQTLEWQSIIWIPAIGGLIVGPLIYFYAREAKGHGVPEVMEAIALKGGLIRKRLVFVKTLASAICIASGGSVGREGPIVQIGSAIGSTISQVLKVSTERMKTLVGCGAAAGIAATFNAPIAGAMFALEIILGDFGIATFSPIVISSVAATAVSRHFLGDSPAFIVPSYELVSSWEFPLYFFLGILCALVALAFVFMLYRTEDFFNQLRFPEYLRPVLGGIMLGCMALVFPQILGVGYGAIDQVLLQQFSWYFVLFLVFVKILATSITIGSGGSGGIFAPSLFIGAMTGGCFGMFVHTVFPDITASPAAYSIVGMGAVVSAATHGPLTAILMLFEMTGDYKIILPLMITCIISSVVISQIKKESIYTLKLIRKGIDIKAGREINLLKSIPVKSIMNKKVQTLFDGLTMGRLFQIISKSKYNSFPVIDKDNKLTGMLSFNDYSEALFNEDLKHLVIVRDIATLDVVKISVNDNIFNALEKISPRDLSILPVVSFEDDTQLLGILTRRDIMRAYNQAVQKKILSSHINVPAYKKDKI
jgi:CIC family chloride channel protein